MHIMVVGLNYKTAPVEIREKVSFEPEQLSEAMLSLKNKKSILENVIISTCNRTEVYAVVDQLHTGRYYIKEFLADWFSIDQGELSSYLYVHEQDGAIDHLFQVACGLNSMVLGETQILGQVKKSYQDAQENSTIGTIFNNLFKRAITLAKKAHAETEINTNAVSISYAAVELGKKIFGSLQDKKVLVIGAGKMGQLAIENLYGSGANKVTVINRTLEKAEKLASKFSGEAKMLDELQCSLIEADILISSTGSKDYVITKELMQDVNMLRKGKPLFMVDIAVPRDLDPNIGEIDNVFLYDIDDLEGIVQANLAERKEAASQIMLMIDKELVEFNQWLKMLGVVPVISALRQKALDIQSETIASMERKLPGLSDREWKVINKHTKSIINQMLKDPILYAKEITDQKHSDAALKAFVEIFNIEDRVEKQHANEASESSARTAPALRIVSHPL